jgi:hypothetical protein
MTEDSVKIMRIVGLGVVAVLGLGVTTAGATAAGAVPFEKVKAATLKPLLLTSPEAGKALGIRMGQDFAQGSACSVQGTRTSCGRGLVPSPQTGPIWPFSVGITVTKDAKAARGVLRTVVQADTGSVKRVSRTAKEVVWQIERDSVNRYVEVRRLVGDRVYGASCSNGGALQVAKLTSCARTLITAQVKKAG